MSKKSTVIESQIESLVALFSDRRLTEALAGADRFIAEHPDHPFGWKLKGALLIEQNQPESALPILQRAIQLSPDEADLLNNFGIALRQTGRLSESLAASQKALGLRPNFAEGHHALAVVLLQMGFLKLAIEHAKEAVQLKPDFPEAWFNLGNACKDALLNEEALQAYVKAFQLRPDMPDVLNNLGNLLRELGKPLEALALYQKAQTIQPELATTYLNLGNLYLDLGQHERAASQYQQALQRDGALIGAQSNLCFCLASSAGADALASMRAAQDYRTMLAQSVQPYANWSAAMAAGQALRIGLVSGDLRLHPVGHFLENVLAELAGTDT
ncbi:tetratricopeptide repeat protein, partial [Allochromatium humboldtianum]